MRRAEKSDYIALQGGVPIVQKHGPLWHITHEYLPEKPTIRTHFSPEERGEVGLDVNGEVVIFEVIKLWDFEGYPCELSSRRNGGDGYTRLEQKQKRQS